MSHSSESELGCLAICLVALVLSPISVHAQDSVALPGVAGEHEISAVSGLLVMPESEPGGDTQLVIMGHMVPGTFWSCETGHSVPYGSEFNLFVSTESGEFELASAHVGVPSEEGAFAIEVPLVSSFFGGPIDLFVVPSTLSFELYIGYHPDHYPHMCYIFSPGVVTIDIAQIVSSASVISESSSWSSIKRQYR